MRKFFIGYGFDQPEETRFRLAEWLTFRHSMLPRFSIKTTLPITKTAFSIGIRSRFLHSATKQNHQAKSYEDDWHHPMCPTIDDPKNK